MPTRRTPLLLSLAGYVVATILIAWSPWLIISGSMVSSILLDNVLDAAGYWLTLRFWLCLCRDSRLLTFLSGLARNGDFLWATLQHRGPALYISSIFCLGILSYLATGVGPVEVTASVRAYTNATPDIFSPRRGLFRVYAMTDVPATSGMTIGAAMARFLQDKFGYTCFRELGF
ncbi:hypothetical protein N7455_003794, partial [Penicillium solitum]|uniref:uncharacterized protein n=1 Tax=Penicillium solitum TaxID=60172 RepID=UPI0032C42976